MMERSFFIYALKGMRAEVVAQGLNEVGADAGAAVGVDVFHGVGIGRYGNAFADGQADDLAQAGLVGVDLVEEEFVEHEVFQIRVLFVGFGDLVQEFGLNDAAARKIDAMLP